MDKRERQWFYPLFGFLLLAILACTCTESGLSGLRLPGQELIELGESVATVAGVAAGAEELAGTVVASGSEIIGTAQVGETIATVVAEGGGAVGTMQASELPGVALMKERLANLELGPDGTGEVSYTEEEVNQAIEEQLAQEAEEGATPVLADPEVQFEDGSVRLDALLLLAEADIVVNFVPVVEEGEVRFDVREAQMGTLTLPGIFLGPVDALVGAALSNILEALPPDKVVRDITVTDELLTVIAEAR